MQEKQTKSLGGFKNDNNNFSSNYRSIDNQERET